MADYQRLFTPIVHLLDLIYPPQCAGCGARGVTLCSACLARMRPLTHQRCAHCHRPLPAASAGRCATCAALPDAGLDGLRVFGVYEDPLRRAIHAFKYAGQRRLGEPLGRLLAERAAEAPAADLVLPVPLHPRRERERGYNQAKLLAAVCAGHLGIPLRPGLLRRVRHTQPQVGLSRAARSENVAAAFAVPANNMAAAVSGRRLLLVDDVTTSGATLTAAARALLQAGASSVWGLALACPEMDADRPPARD